MATTYTQNYGLGKQEDHSDKFDMSVITANADIIDRELKSQQNQLNTKPDAEDITALQAQINQIEISASAEAVVAPEVAAARVGEDGKSYSTLKQRLDTEGTLTNDSVFTINEKKLNTDINVKGLWEQGHLTDSGENGASTASYYSLRIRTKTFIPTNIKYIAAASDVKFLVYKYTSSGVFVSYTTVTSGSYTLDDTYKYRIVIGYVQNNVNITIDEYNKVNFYLSQIHDVLGEIETAIGDYSSLGSRLDSTDNTVTDINRQLLLQGETISPSNIANDYKLVGDGTCVSDSTALIKKYAVTEGDTLYLKIAKVHDGVYQWQDSAIIPTSNPTHLISASTEAIDDFVVVPAGATYLMVSEAESGTTNIVASTVSKIETQEAAIAKVESEKVSSRAIKYDYLKEKNNRNFWEQGHLTDDGQNGNPSAPFYLLRIRTKTFVTSMDCLAITEGYIYIIYKYNMDGTFVDYTKSNVLKYDDFDFENYKYRIALGKSTSNTEITVDEYDAAYFLEDSISDTKDIFDKSDKTDFGIVGSAYYRGLGADYNAFGRDTLYSEVVTAYDTISGLEKTQLGLSSDDQMIVGYTYTPKRTAYYSSLTKKLPKLIIISAQHGFEKSSVYGLYYFLKDLTERYEQNELLNYIHDNVQLIIVPVVNPWGFDNNDYLNANGVNINRNYLCDAWKPSEPGTSQYGGPEPFSEPESQIIRDLVLANTDAYLFFDYHTNGGDAINENRKINWHSYRTSSSEYYNKLKYASARHITKITSMFAKDYGVIFGADEVAGYIDDGNSTASSEKWAYDNNIIGITFEGFNGFKGESAFTPQEKKANSELIGNFIGEALKCYSNNLY